MTVHFRPAGKSILCSPPAGRYSVTMDPKTVTCPTCKYVMNSPVVLSLKDAIKQTIEETKGGQAYDEMLARIQMLAGENYRVPKMLDRAVNPVMKSEFWEAAEQAEADLRKSNFDFRAWRNQSAHTGDASGAD